MIAYSQKPSKPTKAPLTDEHLKAEAQRVLRRLSEPRAVLAVAQNMQKAIVIRDAGTDMEVRTAIVENEIAEAMALKSWIACATPGRVSRYHITREGRLALNKMLAESENRASGFSEAPTAFQGAPMNTVKAPTAETVARKRIRYSVTETPVVALARRKDREGRPFLSQDLVRAGERLREDFELAQIPQDEVNTTEGLQRFLMNLSPCKGRLEAAAQDRVVNALRELGPGLGDVVLRCCCFLEGLEKAEKRMGWSARSGKIVLRIALQRLKRHYDTVGEHAGMMG